ncbi:hypothetical protein Ciccas_014460 [Cichlidogyrus casuarinus]|uniref:Uncharacterized protein n=1 Tax=Cichlidogyrus casuarinus TaxID=1844966 RepID=A0ABD2PIR8_9PLAT
MHGHIVILVLVLGISLPGVSATTSNFTKWVLLKTGQEMLLDEELWMPSKMIPLPDKNFYGFCALKVDRTIYYIGGVYDRLESPVYFLRPGAQSWSRGPSLKQYRLYFSAVSVGTRIYVFGGANLATPNAFKDVDSCEYLETNDYGASWQSCAAMSERKSETTSVVYDGKVYVFGGQTNQVERYDPATNTWRRLASMPEDRFSFVVAVLDNLIYVAGGTDKNHRYSQSINVFDPSTEQWRNDLNVAPTIFQHFWAPMIAFNGSLYIAGHIGQHGGYVEKYDPTKNSWQLLPHKMIRHSSHRNAHVLL